MTGDSVGENVDLAGLRTLFEEAAAGLNPSEREVIELRLRQGLEAAEVATVLGVSPGQARLLLDRADEQLATCLTVLLVGRAGRGDCGTLGALLADWDGQLTAALRKRLHRHITRCATCTDTRAAELRSARLLDMPPGAALAAGAAESSRATPRTPSALKAHTIALATGRSTIAAAYSIDVLARVGTFSKQGFPKPARARRRRIGRHRRAGRPRAPRPFPPRQATAATGVVVALTAAAVAYAITGTSQHFMTSAYPKRHLAAAAASAAPLGDAAREDLPAPSAVRGVPVSAVPSVTLPLPTRATPAAKTPATPEPATSGQEADAAAETGATPGSASGAAVPAQGAAGHPARSAPTRPAASQGTLSALPDGGTLIVLPGWLGSLVALRASGGTVRWSATVTDDGDHAISVWPSSGTLTPADPVTTLTIKASQAVACGSGGPRCPTVTLSPGGTQFTVWPAGGLSDVLNGSGPLDGGMPLPSVTSTDSLPTGRC